ncbi:GRB10 interacting GYF protein 1 [Trapelia coarctata]|nr:GRB10 interacting GYF protein 1 [Trapelia coarctata]
MSSPDGSNSDVQPDPRTLSHVRSGDRRRRPARLDLPAEQHPRGQQRHLGPTPPDSALFPPASYQEPPTQRRASVNPSGTSQPHSTDPVSQPPRQAPSQPNNHQSRVHSRQNPEASPQPTAPAAPSQSGPFPSRFEHHKERLKNPGTAPAFPASALRSTIETHPEVDRLTIPEPEPEPAVPQEAERLVTQERPNSPERERPVLHDWLDCQAGLRHVGPGNPEIEFLVYKERIANDPSARKEQEYRDHIAKEREDARRERIRFANQQQAARRERENFARRERERLIRQFDRQALFLIREREALFQQRKLLTQARERLARNARIVTGVQETLDHQEEERQLDLETEQYNHRQQLFYQEFDQLEVAYQRQVENQGQFPQQLQVAYQRQPPQQLQVAYQGQLAYQQQPANQEQPAHQQGVAYQAQLAYQQQHVHHYQEQLAHQQQLAYQQPLPQQRQLAQYHQLVLQQRLAQQQQPAQQQQAVQQRQLVQQQQLAQQQQLPQQQQLAYQGQLGYQQQPANQQQFVPRQPVSSEQLAPPQQPASTEQPLLTNPPLPPQFPASFLHAPLNSQPVSQQQFPVPQPLRAEQPHRTDRPLLPLPVPRPNQQPLVTYGTDPGELGGNTQASLDEYPRDPILPPTQPVPSQSDCPAVNPAAPYLEPYPADPFQFVQGPGELPHYPQIIDRILAKQPPARQVPVPGQESVAEVENGHNLESRLCQNAVSGHHPTSGLRSLFQQGQPVRQKSVLPPQALTTRQELARQSASTPSGLGTQEDPIWFPDNPSRLRQSPDALAPQTLPLGAQEICGNQQPESFLPSPPPSAVSAHSRERGRPFEAEFLTPQSPPSVQQTTRPPVPQDQLQLTPPRSPGEVKLEPRAPEGQPQLAPPASSRQRDHPRFLPVPGQQLHIARPTFSAGRPYTEPCKPDTRRDSRTSPRKGSRVSPAAGQPQPKARRRGRPGLAPQKPLSPIPLSELKLPPLGAPQNIDGSPATETRVPRPTLEPDTQANPPRNTFTITGLLPANQPNRDFQRHPAPAFADKYAPIATPIPTFEEVLCRFNGPEMSPPAPAHPDVPDTTVTNAQDRQARGQPPLERDREVRNINRRQVHTPSSRAQAALAAAALAGRRGSAGGRGGRGVVASGSGGGIGIGASGGGRGGLSIRGGGDVRRGSIVQRGVGAVLPGMDMPDSFQERQQVEDCVQVLDSLEVMAGIACWDNEGDVEMLMERTENGDVEMRDVAESESSTASSLFDSLLERLESEDSDPEAREASAQMELLTATGSEEAIGDGGGRKKRIREMGKKWGLEEEVWESDGSEEGEIVVMRRWVLRIRGGGGEEGRKECVAPSIPQIRLRYEKKLIGAEDSRPDEWEDEFEVEWWDSDDDDDKGKDKITQVSAGRRGAEGKGKGPAGGAGGRGASGKDGGRGAGGGASGRGASGKDAARAGDGKGKAGNKSPKTEKKGKSSGRRGAGGHGGEPSASASASGSGGGTFGRMRREVEEERRRRG